MLLPFHRKKENFEKYEEINKETVIISKSEQDSEINLLDLEKKELSIDLFTVEFEGTNFWNLKGEIVGHRKVFGKFDMKE